MATEPTDNENATAAAPAAVAPVNRTPLVIRSDVPEYKNYGDYRQYLRADFYYSCAYCAVSEAEALGISFEIDHYEPVTANPELKAEYKNLMYSCEICNGRKSDITPTPEARAAGKRFFRADEDYFEDHFRVKYAKIDFLSATGEFTIDFLDLNRESLRRIRDIRERLEACEEYVGAGIRALSKRSVDSLPNEIKAQAQRAIADAKYMAASLSNSIDIILKGAAKSPFLDPEPEAAARLKEQSEKLKDLKRLFPGMWQGRAVAKAKAAATPAKGKAKTPRPKKIAKVKK